MRPKLMVQVQQFRQYLYDAFQGVDIRLNRPQGSYALWLRMPEQIDSLALYYHAQKRAHKYVPGLILVTIVITTVFV